jgi:hypothetical protein
MSYTEEQRLMDGKTSERLAAGEPAKYFTGIQPRPTVVLYLQADTAGRLYTGCSVNLRALHNSVIWRNTGKYTEHVANNVFPISNVGVFYIGKALTALHSLHF